MDYVKHEVSSVPQEPDPQQLLPSFQFVPTRMQVTWTAACYGDSGPGAPGAGPYASAPAGVLRCPTPAAATRNGPRHRRRTWRRGRRAAPRFTLTVLRARLPQGANESPGGLRRRCPAWSPSQLSQVCGAQVTAPGKRENCKIVAAKSTPLKMAIILTFRVSNNPSGRLMRQPPCSWPRPTQVTLGHSGVLKAHGPRWRRVVGGAAPRGRCWFIHTPGPQQVAPMGSTVAPWLRDSSWSLRSMCGMTQAPALGPSWASSARLSLDPTWQL